ncbi:hypothetical protein NLJ89_g2767 [Agrocybe chaxingu]|uniref:Uncharacterized protein n=1 Tax=Agrocybe chaxingu TaxID=84603 RepID=A0A9W8MXV6_9AGAR|nr:hypothetical protein NLJ89_g2767 [Agrocybe chaxingu]
MQFKTLAFAALQVLAVVALDVRADPDPTPEVLTAKRVVHTLIQQSPFLVESTTTVTWTQSASISPTEPVASPTPTIN